MRSAIHSVRLCGLFTLAISWSGDFKSQCASLANHNFENTTIYTTSVITDRTSISLPDTNATCPRTTSTGVDLYPLTAYAGTPSRSGINFEVWLSSNRTGLFISLGNGGLSRCIDYASLAYSTSHGFAAVSANSGHNRTSSRAFSKNEDVVTDLSGDLSTPVSSSAKTSRKHSTGSLTQNLTTLDA
jgi:feruloyl esterase